MNLAVFHYHFLTGGVTTVIRQALPAIRKHLREIDRVELVGGRTAGGLAEALPRYGVRLHSYPAIDYREDPGADRPRTAAAGRELAARLLERFGGQEVVWWVHNHHLGKNPVFTQAILEVLSGSSGQRVILQIHDFPEAGRFANLRLLERTVSLPRYPVGPNVRYAVLTGRDRSILRESGIPEPHLFLLGNPVPPPAPAGGRASPDSGGFWREPSETGEGPGRDGPGEAGSGGLFRAEVRRRLAQGFGPDFPAYDPGRPLALYPVRTIRRKNVLEACLLCRLSEEPVALAVTLPGTSAAETPYSDQVESAFRSGLCSGVWGIGPRLQAAGLRFGQLVRGADLVVSSAVQEGFGYLFVNSLQWRRPLVAREIGVLEGAADLFASCPALFYHAVSCPVGGGERARLRARYLGKLSRLSGVLPPHLLPSLEEEIESAFSSELVEFSYLPVTQQEEVLARFDDPGVARELRRANRELAHGIPGILHRPVPDRSAPIEERFGLPQYARKLGAILDSFADPSPPGTQPDPTSVQSAVLRRFARLEYLRLLYD